ncbi:MAG TPA: hypothetical protein VNJ09_03280 [Chthonomonadales bacterium]|nr:hypothetical protein [Chthonomonadales bacterium]
MIPAHSFTVVSLLLCTMLSWGMTEKPKTRTPSSSSPPRVAFEMLGEQSDGVSVQYFHLLYDRGRFRLENLGSARKRPELQSILFYDGSKPPVVWGWNPTSGAAVASNTFRLLQVAAKRYGAVEAKHRYRLPAAMPIPIPPNEDLNAPPMPGNLCLTRADLPKRTWRKVGSEKVAGHSCAVYEAKETLRKPFVSIRDYGATVEGNPTRSYRVWVEPRYQLVLRLEERIEYPNSPVPPMSQTMRVHRLHLLKSVPQSRFQLPAGSTAHIPEILKDVRLPAGVKRVRMMGGFWGIGIDFHGYGRSR